MAAPRAKPEILAPNDVFPPTQTQMIQPEASDEGDSALLNIIADLGGSIDAKVNVYKASKGSRQMDYVGSYDAPDFSLDALKAEYGGGSYRIHVRRDGQLVANRLLSIAEPKNQPHIQPQAAPQIDPAQLLSVMQQGFQTLGQSLLEGVARLIPPPQAQKTTQEMLQEMMLMKQLISPGEAAPQKDPFEVFQQGMAFAKDLTPREGDVGTNEVMLEALKVLAPVLGSALQKPAFDPRQTSPGIVPPAQLSSPALGQHVPAAQPLSHPLNPSIAAPQPEGVPEMSLQEKMFFNTIIAAAKADADPSTYSALVLDLIGNDQALQLVSMPDWFEQLVAREPRAFAYREWFDEMRENIYLLTETPLPATSTGNANPVPTDAIIGQPSPAITEPPAA
jgi:hypothetical protein